MKKAQFFLAAMLVVMLMTVVGCGTNTNWPDKSDNGINGTGNGTTNGIMNDGNGYNNNGYNNNGYNNNGYNYTTSNGITTNNNR